jgi:hypothetical protein
MLAQSGSTLGPTAATSGPDVILIVGFVLALIGIALTALPVSHRRIQLGIATLCYMAAAELLLWYRWPDAFPALGLLPALAGIGCGIFLDRRANAIPDEDRGVIVDGAAWGRDGVTFRIVTPVVRSAIDRKSRSLRIRASNDDLVGGVHNDPCPGIEKELRIQWAYNGNKRPEARFCEGDTARLPLPKHYVPCDLSPVPPDAPAGIPIHMDFGDAQTSSLGTAVPRQPDNPARSGAEAPQVAPEGHITHLRATAEAMGKAVRSGQIAGGRDRRTAALLAHVPELAVPLATWDAAVRGVLEAQMAYRKLVDEVVAELDDDVYVRATVGEAIRSTVDGLLSDVNDFQKPSFNEDGRQMFWTLRLWWDDDDPISPVQWSKPNMMPVLIYGSESAEQRVECILALQRAFKWVCYSPEVAAIPRSENAKGDAMEAVVPVLDSCVTRFDLMYVQPDCPDCP